MLANQAARRAHTPLFHLLRFALSSATLLAVTVSAAAGAEARDAAPSRNRAPATVQDPALVLSTVQAQLAQVTGAARPAAEAVDALARALVSAKGRAIETAIIDRVAADMAAALAPGSLNEESLERLAQDLYAAVNSRALTEREVDLLTLDVAALLTEAGAEGADVSLVTTGLQVLCGIPPKPLARQASVSGPSILSRR